MALGRSAGWRMGITAFLTLALLIPISMVSGVVSERKQRRDEAVAEITSTWGGRQSVVGPVLTVPYRYRYKTEKNEVVDGKQVKREVIETATDVAYFLPSELAVDGAIDSKRLHRGIYEAVVYSGKIGVSGRFPIPDFKSLKIEPEDVVWADALVAVAVPDLRGAKGALSIKIGGRAYSMLPGAKLHGWTSGAHAPVGDAARGGFEFALPLDLNGSDGVSFAPLGVRTTAALKSAWPNPKFAGSFLPVEREVRADGFAAKWDVAYYGRSYPQAATLRSGAWPDRGELENSFFGVSFLPAIDSYRSVERATKYGILFVSLVFCAFFLFETLAGLRIHPAQYVLVGLALALFFMILLALSEFLPFWLSYAAAALGASAMIVSYSAKFLGGGKGAAILGGELACVYGYLYVVLQLQDFSLLMGCGLLAATLGAIMWLTRDVDWYALDEAAAR